MPLMYAMLVYYLIVMLPCEFSLFRGIIFDKLRLMARGIILFISQMGMKLTTLDSFELLKESLVLKYMTSAIFEYVPLLD